MKKPSLILLFIFLIPVINALPALQISPSSINANMNYSSIMNQKINLTNTGDQILYNVSFSPINNVSYANLPSQLNPNQTAEITISIPATNINSQAIASFLYNSTITATPTLNEINISAITYSPPYLEVKQGDTIRWRNIDNQTRSVTRTDFSFDYNIAPSTSQDASFSTIEAINYFEQNAGFGGQINVLSNQIVAMTHNSALDVQFPIQMTATYAQTNASLSTLINSFTIEYNEVPQDYLVIQNTGSSIAKNLVLNMQWLNINESNFDIDPNQNKVMPFNIIPNITQTTQTNQTYPLTLTLTGNNIPTVTTSINVFIKYHDFGNTTSTSTNGSVFYVLTNDAIKSYCTQYPANCPSTIQNQTIYVDKPHPVNVTQDTFDNLLNATINDNNARARFENEVKDKIINIDGSTSAIQGNVSATNQVIQTLDKKFDKVVDYVKDIKWNTLWFNIIEHIVWFIIIGGMTIFGYIRYWYLPKRNQRLSF